MWQVAAPLAVLLLVVPVLSSDSCTDSGLCGEGQGCLNTSRADEMSYSCFCLSDRAIIAPGPITNTAACLKPAFQVEAGVPVVALVLANVAFILHCRGVEQRRRQRQMETKYGRKSSAPEGESQIELEAHTTVQSSWDTREAPTQEKQPPPLAQPPPQQPPAAVALSTAAPSSAETTPAMPTLSNSCRTHSGLSVGREIASPHTDEATDTG
eukprot:TRINITY_DN60155_c0_g1_i1.p1 TRINITY_DN60155_c0_g1~~TRINITY_DN60155_c0_g1_i1.p1  ORF type:complete len:211 (+),score=42.09 TRINITY_DN60155_c0_g1_i1:170-802(+)